MAEIRKDVLMFGVWKYVSGSIPSTLHWYLIQNASVSDLVGLQVKGIPINNMLSVEAEIKKRLDI